MNDFTFYFRLGWQHIISRDAADHILFITTLAAIYLVRDWKQLLVLVTAFTVGHSFTLALSVYNLVKISSRLVEFLIPLTIMATAIFNLFQRRFEPSSLRQNYLLALLFGLVHGLGFATTIRMMLAKSQTIALPLFGFNVGLEAGQILVVTIVLLVSFLLVDKAGFSRKWWVRLLSAGAICCSGYMLAVRSL